MGNQIKLWKLISVVLAVILVVIGILFYVKNKQSDIVYIETIYDEEDKILTPLCEEKFDTEMIPEGEQLYTFGSILRMDDLLVDDQYYAFLRPEGPEKVFNVEFSNEVKIKVFKDQQAFAGELVSVDIKKLRELVRATAKNGVSWKEVYKVRIKNNLIENVEQVSRSK